MIDLAYHKGQKCVYGSTFCQEGFCAACNIHVSRSMEDMFASAGSTQRTTVTNRKTEYTRFGSLQPI